MNSSKSSSSNGPREEEIEVERMDDQFVVVGLPPDEEEGSEPEFPRMAAPDAERVRPLGFMDAAAVRCAVPSDAASPERCLNSAPPGGSGGGDKDGCGGLW